MTGLSLEEEKKLSRRLWSGALRAALGFMLGLGAQTASLRPSLRGCS